MIDLCRYRLIDLSHELIPGERKQNGTYLHGEPFNGRSVEVQEFYAYNARMHFIQSQTHNGTHVEAPYKYDENGADIANMCNESALIAARNGKKAIHHQDFLDAVDRIVGGLEKKNKVITPKEKKVIAFHEAGHATISWMLEHAAPLVKVTIVPRGQSLGAAWYLPAERMIVQTEQMLDEMCATMGGRAAEKVMFDKISTGALSDLEKVTKQARAMVTVYGLNEEVGNITYYDSSGNDSFVKPYSEDTGKKIDKEISKMIEEQYTRAIDILDENKDKLTILADLLLEKEVIFKDDLEKIFGKRPFEDVDDTVKVTTKEKEVTPPVVESTEE